MKRNLQIAIGFLSLILLIEGSSYIANSPSSFLRIRTSGLTAAVGAPGSTKVCVSTDPAQVITPPSQTPICTSFTAAPAGVASGAAVTLSWQTANATSITIDGGVGAVTPAASGSTTVHPTASITYKATVTNGTTNVTCLAPVTVSTGGGSGNEVPASRLRLLSRGVNADNIVNNSRVATYTTDDIAKLKSMGMTNIRIPIDPSWVIPGAIIDGNPVLSDVTRANTGLARLDANITNFINGGLAVTLVPQPQASLIAAPLATYEDTVLRTTDVLTARYASQYTPDQIFFETVNEPHMDNPSWNAFAPQIVTAIRKNAPNHTIIVPPAWYDLVTNFADLTPINDPNIIYTMHVYFPGNLTAQGSGATVDPNYLFPKPVGSTNTSEITEARLDAYIKVGVDWAAAHQVPLIMNEFGATSRSDHTSRDNWIRFVRAEAEKYNVGWAWWAFDGRLYGIKPHTIGTFDPDLVQLLSS